MFIPLRIRILHLFGRTSFIIGFLFSLIGLAFIVFFSFQINWQIYFAGKKDLVVTRQDGSTFVHKANPATLRFNYLDFSQNIDSLLAQWDTTGDDKWEVKLTTYDGAGNPVGTDTHLIQLDNTWPEASIEITTGTGNCGKFPISTLLEGKFVARDLYLRKYDLYVSPNVNPPGVGVPNPSTGIVNTPLAPGANWNLDTTLMAPCGYVIWVRAIDRAIRNSQSLGHYTYKSAGFCLEEEGKGKDKDKKKNPS